MDVSYRDGRVVAARVVFDRLTVADINLKTGESEGAYMPTLFFLREGPIISAVIGNASIDLLFVNGHGICHPYSYGLATVKITICCPATAVNLIAETIPVKTYAICRIRCIALAAKDAASEVGLSR